MKDENRKRKHKKQKKNNKKEKSKTTNDGTKQATLTVSPSTTITSPTKQKRPDHVISEIRATNMNPLNEPATVSAPTPAIMVPISCRPQHMFSSNTHSSSFVSWKDAFQAAASIPQVELDDDFLRRTAPRDQQESDDGEEHSSDDSMENRMGVSKVSQLVQEYSISKLNLLPYDGYNNSHAKSISQGNNVKETGLHAQGKKRIREKNENHEPVKRGTTENVSKGEKKQKQSKGIKGDPPTKERNATDNLDPYDENDGFQNNSSLQGSLCQQTMVNPTTGKNEELSFMILTDPKKKIVYSATLRTKEEEYLAIGVLDHKGQIIFQPDVDFFSLAGTSNVMTHVMKARGDDEDDIPEFPFPTNADDHCESPLDAYEDIVPLLSTLSEYFKVSHGQTIIYDPYFCSGSVVRNLSKFGFTNVYNKKEDCYSVWISELRYPHYHIFVTNPPYSGDHIERLMGHLTSKSKQEFRPWFLLMPTWVHKKDYYTNALASSSIQPFYIVPKKRYVYLPPKNFREKKLSDVHKKSSPFVSMWYVWGGDHVITERLIQTFLNSDAATRCDVARSKSALRDLRRKWHNETSISTKKP